MSMSYDQKAILEVETAGSAIEAAAGIAVIVLAIIGLARHDTGFMTSITGIVLGAALLTQGGTIAAELSKLLTMIGGGAMEAVELGGGMTVELLAGGGAIVLGILGLLGFAPEILLPAAVIGVGASLVLSASGLQRLNTIKVQAAGIPEIAQKVAQAWVAAAVAAQVLAGGAAVVLGILALTMGAHAAVLTLVALLILGVSVALSSTALTGRLMRLFSAKQA
jgi:hypothetical protein